MHTIERHGSNSPRRRQICSSYALSLLWISLVFAAITSSALILNVIYTDFIHVNPNRTRTDAAEMMALFPVIFILTAVIGCFLVFGTSQFIQALIHKAIIRLHWRYQLLAVIISTPLTAVVTWYCWEYLTPTDVGLGINAGPDWQPFQHGLSKTRYLMTLAIQVPISIYSWCYFDPYLSGMSKRAVLGLFILLVIIWCLIGYSIAT